jgi:hypothetical protein
MERSNGDAGSIQASSHRMILSSGRSLRRSPFPHIWLPLDLWQYCMLVWLKGLQANEKCHAFSRFQSKSQFERRKKSSTLVWPIMAKPQRMATRSRAMNISVVAGRPFSSRNDSAAQSSPSSSRTVMQCASAPGHSCGSTSGIPTRRLAVSLFPSMILSVQIWRNGGQPRSSKTTMTSSSLPSD